VRAFPSQPASAFSFKEILYGKEGGVARITINRPGRYNAYSTACLEELARAFRDASFDDAVGVIVLTGAGNRAFCTGGDVKEYAETYVATPRDYWKYITL
jgi:enoyl-CoA hydratase/carnithine racemase